MSLRPIGVSLVVAALTFLSTPARSDVGAARYEYEKGNFAAALQQIKPLAEAGDGNAQVFLAEMYVDGKALPQDAAHAAEWYWKAATAGNIKAQLALSTIYAGGRGVQKDDDLANYWKWQAAVAYAGIEKSQLDIEIATQQKSVSGAASGARKYVAPIINLKDCKEPAYKRNGYGYHLSGDMRLLFVIEANGKILEASLAQKSDWPVLDRAFLDSFTKTCTFKPAINNGTPVMGLYQLQASWSVDP